MEIKIDQQVRGTRILVGDDAKRRRAVLRQCVESAECAGFSEIVLPTIEPAGIYREKAGQEILGQMYVFPDRKQRELCLRPEGTATVQAVAREIYPRHKDVTLWYEARCFRYERPQAGRYREFTQFGVEWLWPREPEKALAELLCMARDIMRNLGVKVVENTSVKRGLAYYVGDGFEMKCEALGAESQVLGGGAYAEGVGFAVGVDRLAMAMGERKLTIVLNGRPKIVVGASLPYEVLVALAGYSGVPSVSWHTRGETCIGGTLTPGKTLELCEGMIVNVADTGNA